MYRQSFDVGISIYMYKIPYSNTCTSTAHMWKKLKLCVCILNSVCFLCQWPRHGRINIEVHRRSTFKSLSPFAAAAGWLWIILLYTMYVWVKVEKYLLCALEQGRTGSGPRLHLFMCPWEGNAVYLCWHWRYHPCSAPQREKRKERGQIRKRADKEKNKPVIAWDSAHPAKGTSMSTRYPYSWLSAASSDSGHFSRQELDVDIWQQLGTAKHLEMSVWGTVYSLSGCQRFNSHLPCPSSEERKHLCILMRCQSVFSYQLKTSTTTWGHHTIKLWQPVTESIYIHSCM